MNSTNSRTIRISPSVAAAPLDSLERLVGELEQAGADSLHIDLEDGTFVPGVMNLGTRIISELASLTRLPLDVHMMVREPERMLPAVVAAGAAQVSFHFEASPYPRRILRMIKDQGLTSGLAFNPKTPVPDLTYLMPLLDFIDILTTEPELPDWPFLPATLEKVRALDGLRTQAGASYLIQVDGGISIENASEAARAGADILVAGRAVFGGGSIIDNLQELRIQTEAEGEVEGHT